MAKTAVKSEPFVQTVHVVEKLLYRRDEVAFALGISLRAVDYLVAEGKLRTRKMARMTVIPAADVRSFAKEIIDRDYLQGLAPTRKSA